MQVLVLRSRSLSSMSLSLLLSLLCSDVAPAAAKQVVEAGLLLVLVEMVGDWQMMMGDAGSVVGRGSVVESGSVVEGG